MKKLSPAYVMAGHSPLKTGVNALMPGHPRPCFVGREARRGCPRRQVYAACASLAASAGMTERDMRFLKRLAIGVPLLVAAFLGRGLVSARRLSPDAPDRDRGAGCRRVRAGERAEEMGRLVALGEARSERQGDVLRAAVRTGRDVQMGRQRQGRRRHDERSRRASQTRASQRARISPGHSQARAIPTSCSRRRAGRPT